MTNQRENYRIAKEIAYCLFLSTIYLLICTKSSPLYPFNDWVDSNAFFTMGKGMMNGKIPYRDLFEQKGPLLFFIHGISYWISNKTFFGVFIFEVLSFTLFLYYCTKLLQLFINIKYSYITLVFITYIILNMPSFSHGDSAEEFGISLLAISLYYLLFYFVKIYPQKINYRIILINGVIAGCILWIKYTLLGFWIGWIASIFICLVNTKHYSYAIKCCFVFILGVLISSIPWIYYFGVNNSILDLLYVYFFININSYSQEMFVLYRTFSALANALSFTIYNIGFGVIFIFGLLNFTLYDKFIKLKLHRVCLLMCIFILTISIYGSGRNYIYYYLAYSPFIVIGFVSLTDFLHLGIMNKKKLSKVALIQFTSGSIIATIILSLLFNHNTYMLKLKKEDLIQYKFAKIISETENATLLNYGSLDLGLYTITGIIPNVRFFEMQNIDYSRFPLNMDEQNKYIKEKRIDYVIMVRYNSPRYSHISIPYLLENYELTLKDTQMYENIEYEYLLFRKIK